jgi:hypothetical protein
MGLTSWLWGKITPANHTHFFVRSYCARSSWRECPVIVSQIPTWHFFNLYFNLLLFTQSTPVIHMYLLTKLLSRIFTTLTTSLSYPHCLSNLLPSFYPPILIKGLRTETCIFYRQSFTLRFPSFSLIFHIVYCLNRCTTQLNFNSSIFHPISLNISLLSFFIPLN